MANSVPSSSVTSRIAPRRGVSYGSTMPPGSSQSGLNWVSQSSTRPSTSRNRTWAIRRFFGSAEFITPEKPCGPWVWSDASRAKRQMSPYEPSGRSTASRRIPSKRKPERSTARRPARSWRAPRPLTPEAAVNERVSAALGCPSSSSGLAGRSSRRDNSAVGTLTVRAGSVLVAC